MPKRRRPARIPTPSWEQPPGHLGRLRRGLGPRFYLAGGIIGLVLVAIAVIAFGIIRDYIEDRGRPGSAALTVGDTTYSLDYFTDRWRLLGGSGQPLQDLALVADQLVQEELARQFASEFDVSVTAQEVDEEIRQRLGIQDQPVEDENAPDEAAFAALYEQRLALTGLSDEEYRQVVEAQLLIDKIRDALAEGLPDRVEQVKVRQVTVASEEEAQGILARADNGEDFADLAREVDPNAVVEVDELNWTARRTLEPALEDSIFALEEGEIGADGLLLFQVVEKAEREVTDDQRTQMTNPLFRDWLQEKRQSVVIIDFVSNDIDKFQWAANRVYAP